MSRMLLMLALLIAGYPAAAQQDEGFAWRVNDKLGSDHPSRASKDGFGAQMLVTADYEAFLKAWAGPTPPNLSISAEVTREKPVHAMVIFSGCRAGSDGNCNVTARFGITAPDGSQYGDILEGKVWDGPPAPQYNLMLAESGIGFILEPEDQLGTYTLTAAVTDNVAGTTLKVEESVTARLTNQ